MQATPSLETLWQRAHKAQEDTQDTYPDILCRTGCNACCKNHGSPITFATEWPVIRDYLEKHPEQKTRVHKRYQQLKQQLNAHLHLENPTLAQALFEVPCPFIETSKEEPTAEYCGIYNVRPMTCRVFGNSVLQQPVHSGEEIYACNPEKDRWETLLPMAVDLPLRSSFFTELEAQSPSRSLLSYLEAYFYEQS